MARLTVFNSVSLDGWFADVSGDMSWTAHNQDSEWQDYVNGNASGGGMGLFGRVTYQMMAGWWPTEAAGKAFPVVARRMNAMPKVVFTRTLDRADWENTTLVKSDPAAEVRRLKSGSMDMVVLGSGSIVSILAREGLIDELQLIIVPVIIGKGRSMFAGVEGKLPMKLIRTRAFKNGNVLLCYEPAR